MVAVVFSLSGYRYVGDGGTDRRELLHNITYRSRIDLPFGGGTHRESPKDILGLNVGHFWPFDRELLENGKW